MADPYAGLIEAPTVIAPPPDFVGPPRDPYSGLIEVAPPNPVMEAFKRPQPSPFGQGPNIRFRPQPVAPISAPDDFRAPPRPVFPMPSADAYQHLIEPEQEHPDQPPAPVIHYHHPSPTPAPTLGERFMAHASEAFQNTLAGQAVSDVRGGGQYGRRAAALDQIIRYAESKGSNVALPLPPELSAPDPMTGIVNPSGIDPNKEAEDTLSHPFAGTPLADLRNELADEQAAYAPLHVAEVRREKISQAQLEQMPGAQGAIERGAAVAGELAGGLPTPENLVPVGRGTTLLRTFMKGAAAAGLTNLLSDPIVQRAQIDRGVRDKFDPVQPFLGAAGGAFLGGTLNVTPEVAARVAKVVGAKLGKAAEAVTNSDAWRAMSSWLRNPDSMPDELKIEPTLGTPLSGAAVTPSPPGTLTEAAAAPRW